MSARSDALPAEAWATPLSSRSAFAGDRTRYAVSAIERYCVRHQEGRALLRHDLHRLLVGVHVLDGRKGPHHRKPSLVQRLGKLTLDANRRGRIAARLVLSPRRRMQG